jgi:hypothetical protein
MAEKISFDEWKDKFKAEVDALGYTGPVDEDSFETEYDIDVSPEEAARDFVTEMEDDDDILDAE